MCLFNHFLNRNKTMKVLTALLVVGITVIAVSCVEPVRFRISHHSHCVQGAGDLAAIYGLSCDQCVSACYLRTSCNYISYKRLSKECKMFKNDIASRTIREKNCVIIRREDIEIPLLPPTCQSCDGRQVCDVTADQCITTECDPFQLEHGRIFGNMRMVGSRIKCTCDPGFGSSDGQSTVTITCLPSGEWSRSFVCAADCQAPPTVLNAHVTYTAVSHGSEANYQCNDTEGFYEMAGLDVSEMIGVCDGTIGSWKVPNIACVKDCSTAPEVINADMLGDGIAAYLNVTYNCLYGNQSTFAATCDGVSGTWKGVTECSTDDCGQGLIGPIPDSAITASTTLAHGQYPDYYAPFRARLNSRASAESAGAWVAATDDETPFIQADLGTVKQVRRIRTRPRDGLEPSQYITGYSVSYSQDCVNFFYIQESDGTIRNFACSYGANGTTSCLKRLVPPVITRCIRLHPTSNAGYNALRFGMSGCKDKCTSHLVTGPYGVNDSCLTASSYFTSQSRSAEPSLARLDTPGNSTHAGGWGVRAQEAGQNPSEYIQVRFRQLQDVSSVVTQGMNFTANLSIWVKSYSVAYSVDCATFDNVTDSSGNIVANNDSDTKVTNVLPDIISALCVRIQPRDYQDHLGMRFDMNGCFYDNVCPISPERFITPDITSTLALRIMPGTYTKTEAETACAEYGRLLVVDSTTIQEQVKDMITRCHQYSGQVYWVDTNSIININTEGSPSIPAVGSNNVATINCLALDVLATPTLQSQSCDIRHGYICEYVRTTGGSST